MKIYEIVHYSPDGLDNQLVTAEDEESAVEKFDRSPENVIYRGPYLGDGPYRELRAEIKNRSIGSA